MKRRLLCLLFAGLFLLCCACANEQAPPSPEAPAIPLQTALTYQTFGDEALNARVQFLLRDEHENPLSGKALTLVCGADTYTLVTDRAGKALWRAPLAAGEYALQADFEASGQYAQSACAFTWKIAPGQNRSGIYVLGNEMDTVDFSLFAANGIGHIFLRQDAVSAGGKAKTEAFIARASDHGIQVHLWLICLWDKGALVNPFDVESGTLNRACFDMEIEKARSMAALAGLYGIHLDYIRYDGSAQSGERADRYNFNGMTGADAVSAFVREVGEAVRAVNPALKVSGALMPFFDTLYHKFGQDLTALSQYLDFFVPMAYTGNCGTDAAWVTRTMERFTAACPQTEIWAGLLTYVSDKVSVTQPAEVVQHEIESAYAGGACGTVLFRYGFWKDKSPIAPLTPLA